MAQEKQQEQKVKHLVRIHNTDLPGEKPIYYALTRIKGVSMMFSNAICLVANVDRDAITGLMPDQDILKINDVLKNPSHYNIPSWLFNRRSDPITGQDLHVLTSDLDFAQSSDIKFMQKIRCYKGVRHQLGQPVRGQRTRSNFRKNKGKATGVFKTKLAPGSGAAADKKDNKK
jgi:small subunit ribosomal protein S13